MATCRRATEEEEEEENAEDETMEAADRRREAKGDEQEEDEAELEEQASSEEAAGRRWGEAEFQDDDGSWGTRNGETEPATVAAEAFRTLIGMDREAEDRGIAGGPGGGGDCRTAVRGRISKGESHGQARVLPKRERAVVETGGTSFCFPCLARATYSARKDELCIRIADRREQGRAEKEGVEARPESLTAEAL